MEDSRGVKELYSFQETPEEILCTNEYGFVVDSFGDREKDKVLIAKNKWYHLITKCDNSGDKLRKSVKAKRLIYKGVPLSLKNMLWSMLIPRKRFLEYKELVSKRSGYEHQIHVDVQRTFRRHFLFNKEYSRGQCELFNVLSAYSNYNPRVGYCQGMSSPVAILLMYFSEEEAFEMLVSIIERNRLETLFDKRLSKVPKIQAIQEEVFKTVVPEIYNHLQTQGVDINIYVIGWHLTLFTRFDIKLVLRMWDVFLFFDFSTFLFFAAAILRFFARRILELRGEQLIEFIGALDSEDIDVEKVISYAVDFLRSGNHRYYRDRM